MSALSLKLPLPNLKPNLGLPGRVKRSWATPGSQGGGGMFGGLLSGIPGLGNLFGGQAQQGLAYQIGFRSNATTLQKFDNNVTLSKTTANLITKWFQWKVPAGHRYTIPAGSPFWSRAINSGTANAVNGFAQIQVRDPLDVAIKQLYTYPLTLFGGNEFDVRQQPVVSSTLVAQSEDLIEVWLNGDTAADDGTTAATGTQSLWFRGIYN